MATVRWKDKVKQDPIVSTDKFALTDIADDDFYCTIEEMASYLRLNKSYEWTTQTLTDQATLAWDRELGHNATLDCTQSSTLNGMSNPAVGNYTLRVQKTGASGDLLFDPNFVWEGGTKPDFAGSALNSYAIYKFFYDGTKYLSYGFVGLTNIIGENTNA